MNFKSKYFSGSGTWFSLSILMLIAVFGTFRSSYADSLYIGDGSDNTIKRFDASNANSFQGIFAKGEIKGPMGLVFDSDGHLIVSNQNAGTSTNGELLLFAGDTGALLKRIVANSDPEAPAIPRGIVLAEGVIYVAEFSQQNSQHQPLLPGRLLAYRESDGQLLTAAQPTSLISDMDSFHPRGIVFGPDGLLYISNDPNPGALGGQILRYDTSTQQFVDIFVDDLGGVRHLNRPEGLVFGPHGNIYITSFRADATDTDSIRIYKGKSGAIVGIIDLDQVNQPRAFAQALLFGPEGRLFVPISGNGPDTGAVRRYDVTDRHFPFDNFVPPAAQGGPLGAGWYLSFGNTDPATLEYNPTP